VNPQEHGGEDKALDEQQRIVDVPKPFSPAIDLSIDKFIERFAGGTRSRRRVIPPLTITTFPPY
jgi:hypothetical protein